MMNKIYSLLWGSNNIMKRAGKTSSMSLTKSILRLWYLFRANLIKKQVSFQQGLGRFSAQNIYPTTCYITLYSASLSRLNYFNNTKL